MIPPDHANLIAAVHQFLGEGKNDTGGAACNNNGAIGKLHRPFSFWLRFLKFVTREWIKLTVASYKSQ